MLAEGQKRRRPKGAFIRFLLFDGLAEEGNEVGVVMPAGEQMGIGTDREDRNGMRRMCVGRPTDMRFLIEQFDSGFAQGIDRLVHVLRIFSFAFAGFGVKLFEFGLLVGSDLYGVPETQLVAIDRLYLCPRGFLVVLEQLGEEIG